MNGNGYRKIGVYICHCGMNIASTVDPKKVAEYAMTLDSVVMARHYIFMCSDIGQELIENDIKELGLNRVVVASCSPRMHELTFRKVCQRAGLNPYLFEMANIREQCSWVHSDRELATEKAMALVRAAVRRVFFQEPLEARDTAVNPNTLVIGGGIAGIQAALDIANAGYEVVLVERDAAIGGHAIQLSGTFPTLDRVTCLMTSKVEEVASHTMIKLHTYAEVEEVSGYIGNFTVRIRNKASFVDNQLCTDCMLCSDVCPVSVPSEFERGLAQRKAIYTPHSGAVPFRLIVDSQACRHFSTDQCHACQDICPTQAIDFSQKDTFVEEKVGAIIAAPGYDLLPRERISTYSDDPDIIDGLQFERILSSSGPTLGEIRRPSDGKIPEQVVFIQCVGSCDPEHGVPYCSRVCCMYVAKQVLLYRQAVPEGQAYVFYTDIRSDAKGFEEFVQGVMAGGGVLYIRGGVSKVFREGDRIKVWGVDTLAGREVEISADLVVLAIPMVPRLGTNELVRKLNIMSDKYGFLSEAHIKLRPVESLTAGIYLAGTAQWPRDIPDTIASASAAAAKALALISKGKVALEATVASVNESYCLGCGRCEEICEFHAPKISKNGLPLPTASINEVLCKGCGACAVSCPTGAITIKHFTREEILAEVEALAGV